MPIMMLLVVIVPVFFLTMIIFFMLRYRRCPSDQILVVYGKVAGANKSAKCIHGGGTMVWPLFQDYEYLYLTPMTIGIPLTGALSKQNIRVNVPSSFTVQVSPDENIMGNAAICLLGQSQEQIEDMARNIIFGQLRLTVASLTIEEINQNRDHFLQVISSNVEPELNKIGLQLINVNVTDITDEADYIASIGKKAAAEAINRAKIDVATQEKVGSIGEAEANKDKDIQVAQNKAEAEKGIKEAEASQRCYVADQESKAVIGEATATKNKDIQVAQNKAEAEKGMKEAEASQRCYVAEQESKAITGENNAKAAIAQSNAELQVVEAEAYRKAEVAKREAEIIIQKAQYEAEKQRLNAKEIAQQEIDKQKLIIDASAIAEKTREEARGEADATLLKYRAEAEGQQALLEGKAAGYRRLVESAGDDASLAATLLMIEKLQDIVSLQTEAIRNIKIDKVTVWDGGNGKGADGKTSTADFLSGMVKSLPPLHDVAQMAGLQLPEYLGKVPNVDSVAASVAKAEAATKNAAKVATTK